MRGLFVQFGFLAATLSAAVCLMLAAGSARAAPFARADVDAACTSCAWVITGLPDQTTAVEAGTPRTCKRDVANVAVGAFTVEVTCVATDPVWGEQRSPKASKGFARPGLPAAASLPVLVP